MCPAKEINAVSLHTSFKLWKMCFLLKLFPFWYNSSCIGICWSQELKEEKKKKKKPAWLILILHMGIQISICDKFFDSINSGQAYLGSPGLQQQGSSFAQPMPGLQTPRSVLCPPQKHFYKVWQQNPPAPSQEMKKIFTRTLPSI